jgi:hypothetical protein
MFFVSWAFFVLSSSSGFPSLARRQQLRGVTLTATLRHPASLRPSPHIHVQSFGRFDEILYLVEKTSALTLTDCRPLPLPVANEPRAA